MANWTNNHLKIEGDQDQIDSLYKKFSSYYDEDLKNQGEIMFPDFEKVIPIPTEADRNNDWTTKNWGTKWPAQNASKESPQTFYFKTPWNTPEPIIRELSKQYPTLIFTVIFSLEEDRYTINYSYKCKAGKTEEIQQ